MPPVLSRNDRAAIHHHYNGVHNSYPLLSFLCSKGNNPLGFQRTTPNALPTSSKAASDEDDAKVSDTIGRCPQALRGLPLSLQGDVSEAKVKKHKSRTVVSDDDDDIEPEKAAAAFESAPSAATRAAQAVATSKPLNLRPAATVKPSKPSAGVSVPREKVDASKEQATEASTACAGTEAGSSAMIRGEERKRKAYDQPREDKQARSDQEVMDTEQRGAAAVEKEGMPSAAVASAEMPTVDESRPVRMHMVKERVREERTYMDDRGYMVSEEVRQKSPLSMIFHTC